MRPKAERNPLRIACGFEAWHRSLSLPYWLVRVFRSIIQAFVLVVLDVWHDLFLGCGIVGQLAGNNHLCHILASFEQLAEELFAAFLLRLLLMRLSSTLPYLSTAR